MIGTLVSCDKIEIVDNRKSDHRRIIEMIAVARMVVPKVREGLKYKMKISGESGHIGKHRHPFHWSTLFQKMMTF